MNQQVPLNASIDTASIIEPPKQKFKRSSEQEVVDTRVQRLEQNTLEKNNGMTKKMKRSIYTTSICFVIFLIITIVFPMLLENIIKKKAVQGSILVPETQKFWAITPGETQSKILRDFAFFNFTNAQEVLLHGQKPEFRQIQGYGYQQIQQYVDIQYTDNGQHVKYNYWLYFKDKEGARDPNQKVKIINLGPLGFWHTLKHSEPNIINIQGLGILFTNLESIIKNTAIGQGISSQFLPNFTIAYQYLFYPAQIQYNLAQFIWNDRAFGIGNPNNIDLWLDASQKGFNSPEAGSIGNYFTLKKNQLRSLMQKFGQFDYSLNKLLFQNYYCALGQICNGFQLAVRQIAGSQITNNPPPTKGIIPTITICQQNFSCAGGFPQLWSYYNRVFLADPTVQDKYKNLTFQIDMVRNWFVHTTPVNKKQNCLLHAGNLQALWGNGTQYESKNDKKYLQNIKNRFGLPSLEHTHVFWNWQKYFTLQFVNRESIKGNNQITGIGNVMSQTIYRSITAVQDNLHRFLLKYIIFNKIQSQDCFQFFNDSLANIPDYKIQQICDHYDIHNINTIDKFVQVCRNQYGPQWEQLKKIGNISDYQLSSFCDRTQPIGFGNYFQNAQIYLNNHYRCDITPTKYCSDFEIAAMQWSNSTITKFPIKQLPTQFGPSLTINSWIPEIPKFEYKYFCGKFPNNSFPDISTQEAYNLLTFDLLFSGPIIQRIFLQTNKTILQTLYYIKDQESMLKYIRYLVIFVGFGGFTHEKTVKQFLFGYYDDFLKDIKYMDPAIGGDPSIPNFVHLNDLNITRQQAVNYPQEIWSGKNHPQLTNFYYKINGERYQTRNNSKWNGNQTIDFIQSPWEGLDYFHGTNGKQYPANQYDVANVSILVTNIGRYGDALNTGQTSEKYGFKIIKASLSDDLGYSIQQSQQNKKYYQTFPNLFNLTSLQDAPVFASNNHFYLASDNWTTFIDIWDENKSFIYTPNKWDMSFVEYQPYSGVNFQAVLYLQTNYFYQRDNLFTYNQSCMLPFFSVYRAGNFSEIGAEKLLKPLKLGLIVKKIILYVGICLTSIFGMSTIGLGIVHWKKSKIKKEQDLYISMQINVEKQNSEKEEIF